MIKYYPKQNNFLVAMAKKGFTQRNLSEAAKINQSTLSMFINHRRSISASTALKISEALGTSVDEIFEFKIEN